MTKIRRNKAIADKQEDLFKAYTSKNFYEKGNKSMGLEKVKN